MLTRVVPGQTVERSVTVRLTSFDPPQPDRRSGGKGEQILFGRRTFGNSPLDGEAGDLRLRARGAE